MKLSPNYRYWGQQGSVLTITLCIGWMLGFFLFSYFYLIVHQNSLVIRSQNWNAALGMAEAGVEEALGQLNPGAPLPVVDRTANGWGAPVGGLYGPMTRQLGGGSYGVLYTTDAFPVIYATGYVKIAALSATLLRTVKVTTTNAPLFSAGMVGIYGINLNGNGVASDSFNSANTNLSSNGMYDPLKTSTNGDVASVFGIVNVGNANIYGSVYLGPTATNSIAHNGLVTGGISNDFNVEFESVVLPPGTAGWVPPAAGPTTVDGVSYQYAFGYPGSPNSSGNYALSGSSLSGSIYVGTNTQVTLLVTSSASVGNIRVAGQGTNAGHVTLYMDGASFTLSGSNSVDGGNATNLTYYGTTNNTKVSLSGNASFVGTLYAPQANLKLGGGGSNTYDFIGAIVANTVTVNGHFQFHFDENLALAGPKRGYVPNSWQEL